MKRLIKLISVVLCCAVLFQIPVTVYGTEIEEVTEYQIPIVSNESSKGYVTLCEFEGRYFLSFEDIKDFTRSTLEEDDSTVTLRHGIREIKIEKATGSITDTMVGIVEQGDMVEYGKIPVLAHNGSYYCEAIPMLLCLGAACGINEDGKLEILMPSYTIYEAILPEYWTWYDDVDELYGGEEGVKNAITCALISDIFDFAHGEGFFASFDDHIENACYEIVDIDVMEYSSVQGEAIERNQKINSFFISLDAVKTFGIEAMNYYIDFFLDADILNNEVKWLRNYHAGNLEEASKLSKQINQQVYDQSKLKFNTQTADDISSALLLAVDTAVTSYNLMQYDDDSRNIFKRTINDEIIDKAQYNFACKNVTDRITKDLSSNAAIVGSTAADKVTDFVIEEAFKKGLEGALSMFSTNAGLYTAAAQIGGMVSSLVLADVNQAFSADLNAIILGSFQHDALELLRRYTINVGEQNDYLDKDSFENIRNLFMLYYRTSIAFNENYAVAVEKFDVQHGQTRAELRRGIADRFANYLYRITNCAMVPLVNGSIFEQEVITQNWISEAAADDPQEIMISKDEQYKLNIFLSNFSEQWFHESYIWDEQRQEGILVSDKFESQTGDVDEIVDFAWLYAELNMNVVEEVPYGDRWYFGIDIDTIISVSQRFFGRSIDPADIQTGEMDKYGDYNTIVIDGKLCHPIAAGETYNHMTVAQKLYDLGNGTMRVDFSIYEVTDSGIGTIADRSVYYLSPEEANSRRNFDYRRGGVAVVKPYTADNGKDTYQLVSYELLPKDPYDNEETPPEESTPAQPPAGETEKFTPSDDLQAADDAVREAYIAFLTNREYESKLREEEQGDWDSWGAPKNYAVMDLNGNGVPELLLRVDLEDGWVTEAIFTYAAGSGAVEYIASIYNYDGLAYAPDQNMIHYCFVRPTANDAYTQYCTIRDGVLEAALCLCMEFDFEADFIYYILYADGSKASLTESAYESFTDRSVYPSYSVLP